MQLPADASVLVLLVATDGATWLPEVLKGLRAQRHRPLKILAIDNASSDGTAGILAKAFGARKVVTLERRVGYGRALAAGLKVAADQGLDADAFLLLHDDCALEPDAIAAMIEALRGDDVGIVGGRVLEWDASDLLQEFGGSIDRYGRVMSRIERGELDQGQYEGVHDALYASSAALLVAREVVETVGLFDLRFVVLRDDLDLCWRARIAGYRTVVTADARARHAAAGVREVRAVPPRGRVRYYGERNMIATLIKNYSWPRLALALPLALGISLASSLLFLATGRRRAALQVLEAWQWNIAHLPTTVRGRLRAQHTRRRRDAEVTALMHRGASRLRSQLARAVETVVGEVEPGTDEDLEKPPPRLIDRVRAHPSAVSIAAAIAVGLIGSRGLWGAGDLAGADLAPFPDRARDLFETFASGWRDVGAGGAGPATPGLVLLGLLTLVCFGSGWLAQRVLLLGLPVAAAITMVRLTTAIGLAGGARRIAVALYVASPLLLAAFGTGRLADLVLAAAAPGLLVPLLRMSGVAPDAGWRSAAAGALGLAISASLAPWSLVLVAGTGVVLAAVRPGAAMPVVRRAGGMVLAALALLLPWSVELFRPGSPLGAGAVRGPGRMLDLLGMQPGSVRPLPSAVAAGTAIAALAGVLLARGERRASARTLALLGVASLLASWLIGRGVGWIAPRGAVPLVLAAVSGALLAGIAFEAVPPLLTQRTFGVPHVAAALVGAVLVAHLGLGGLWVARGERPGVVEAGSLVPSFFGSEQAEEGAFRVAWVSGTATEPVVSLTDPTGGSIRGYLARPGGAAADALRRTVAAAAAGATEAAGRLLATFGVRYVVVRPEASRALAEAFSRQPDLRFSQRFRGATIYRDEVELPVAASVGSSTWVAASRGDLGGVGAADPTPRVGPGFSRTSVTTLTGETGIPSLQVLLAEEFSDGWRARVGGRSIPGAPSFGWATRFEVTVTETPVRLEWTGQRGHRAALVGQALLLAAFGAWWSQRAARERGER